MRWDRGIAGWEGRFGVVWDHAVKTECLGWEFRMEDLGFERCGSMVWEHRMVSRDRGLGWDGLTGWDRRS